MTEHDAKPVPSEVERPIDLSKLFEDMAVLGNHLRELFYGPETTKILEGFSKAVRHINAINEFAQASVEPLLRFVGQMAEKQQVFDLVTTAGWLPHHTTPIKTLSRDMTVEQVDQALSNFYSSEVDHVEQHFFKSIDRYDLDQQVRSTFREALQCHRRGYYRATVRLLFPEIERVACKQLYDGRHKGNASLPKFADLVGRLPLGQFPDVEAPLRLFKKLESHLYMSVWDEAGLANVAADAVPNRHAAIHGFIDYSTMQNSMNTIIMADFIFQLFGSLQLLQRQDRETD